MVGRLTSFWNDLFSGAFAVSFRECISHTWQLPPMGFPGTHGGLQLRLLSSGSLVQAALQGTLSSLDISGRHIDLQGVIKRWRRPWCAEMPTNVGKLPWTIISRCSLDEQKTVERPRKEGASSRRNQKRCWISEPLTFHRTNLICMSMHI